MPQINNGRVRLVNGSTTVQALYNVYLTSSPSELQIGSPVQWGATGSHDDGEGVIVEVDGSSYWIYRSSNSDEPPAVGDVLKLQTSPTVTPTIDSMGAASPPNWSTNLTGVVGTPFFTIRDNTSPAMGVASSTLDELVLTTPWPGSTVANVDYGISTDFTPNLGFPLIAYGDIDSPALISMALTEIDRNLVFSGALIQANATQVITQNTWTSATALDTVDYDVGDWIATAGDSFFTVPTGVTRVRLMGQLDLELIAQNRYVAARIVRDIGSGIEEFAGAAGKSSWDGDDDATPPTTVVATTSAIAVSAGDEFYLQVFVDDFARDIENTVRSWFSIEAVSFN